METLELFCSFASNIFKFKTCFHNKLHFSWACYTICNLSTQQARLFKSWIETSLDSRTSHHPPLKKWQKSSNGVLEKRTEIRRKKRGGSGSKSINVSKQHYTCVWRCLNGSHFTWLVWTNSKHVCWRKMKIHQLPKWWKLILSTISFFRGDIIKNWGS